MEDLIKIIKREVANHYNGIDTLTLVVLFSEGNIRCNILVDGKDIDYEVGVENILKISEYLSMSSEGHNTFNRLIISMNANEIFKKFDFDEDYFISSNQEILNAIVEKIKGNLNIEIQDLKDLLSIAKYAITKVDIKELASKDCKLYLLIESCQLVTDISPNFIKDNDRYLFLCEISKVDIQQSNLESILLRKIKQMYK